MANAFAKFKNSQRRHRDDIAIARQVRIARSHGDTFDQRNIRQAHRLVKHHVMDCGNPKCGLCGNPRHIRKGQDGGLTAQERRLFQDLDSKRDTHSNGLTDDNQNL